MTKTARLLSLSLLLVTGLTSCVMSAGPITKATFQPVDNSTRALTFLNYGSYVDQMIEALINAGFEVPGIATPGIAPTTKYGVRFNFTPTGGVCVLTDSITGNAVLVLVEIETGATIADLRQFGATGPCTTVDPVYPGLARELKTLW